ncbi:Mercuric reductase [Pseudovibrio sp. Ad46]|uniref:dihydrolipoyl dehydrogenase family protein n=1 Tax=unclassified Pseudovibrio TaxID=2627060 RepID=UPI0007AE9273|nr:MULTISPECIES: FAD-dependent oxidoreductase [unclassified Pseudovibrio]KZK93893.1 Mercuric reductase [Pseudovibrio sp. Ad46]KZL00106.1 Mercuric reductase [Pseudovibrio sp. Ad5]KZL01229.1 Mercuric reductase [Pseudovibrio sp. W74]KZL11294.1 Mercuric reductase [Pseudovibrio sp. Ad14]
MTNNNNAKTLTPDICVIGAGSGGLSVAAAAAAFGVDVVLIEKGKMGGDCLNYGCVPSKAIIAAGKAAATFRSSEKFGVGAQEPEIDFSKVNDHVHDVIATIAPHDSVERFEGLGVHVIQGAGEFTSADTVKVGEQAIKARRFVIATGSSAAVPPIPGIENIPYLTNENLFELKERPEHLIIIGAGPIGMEMAQAHRRLGSRVTVIEALRPLAVTDPAHAAQVIQKMESEGVEILANTKVNSVERTDTGVKVAIKVDDEAEGTIEGTHLLIAAGRSPNVSSLGLEAAGIEYSRKGIKADDGLRTTNRKVYAIGDVAGGPQFTHAAGAHASLVIRSILFRMPVNHNNITMPAVTYTEPEIGQVGLSEQQAREQLGDKLKILTAEFSGNDRALAEGKGKGQVKLLTNGKGQLVGASIVGPGAGEQIGLLALMISQKLKVGALLGVVLPYPTLNEAIRRAALTYYADAPKNPWVRRILALLRKLG